MVSLIEALAENCPVLYKQVGKTFFHAMAAEFIRQHPPSSPVLAGYGNTLPVWIECFPPLAEWPWLADLTRLELLFITSLHAADGHPPRLPEQMENTALAMLKMTFDPSMKIFSSSYAVFSLWSAHQQEGERYPVDPLQPEQMLLFRTDGDVRIIPISSAEFSFIHALQYGHSLVEATMMALTQDENFEPGPLLRYLHKHKLILSFTHSEEVSYGVC